MRKSDLSLYKHWVTQSGHFILAATVELGIGITYEKLLFYHDILEQIRDKKINDTVQRKYSS